LPALAAASGCRALSPGGTPVLPADRHALAVPMLDDRRAIAVAYASWSDLERRSGIEAAVAAVERAAVPYALALERESDRIDAAYDGLTGLLGPRAFRRLLREEIDCQASRPRRNWSLWFVDTDGFKRVNDELGHRTGDAVLQAIAELLRAHAGAESGVPARNGGDEFCALLRATGKSRAVARAQAFCDAVRAYDFGVPIRITASVGVAAYPHDAASASGLLEAADAAMYHSKRNGRDRVSFVTEGGFACAAAEAALGDSRTFERCRFPAGESSAERSPP
ncbi:MAG TPA: GGDEF domain-containing protein, partial [Candidatus Tumulicola sp.]|nr:GGDEF domain-containing protein [Candidatus Tumulicola sp.]